MRQPVIEEAKLPAVMKIIDEAAALMEEKDCQADQTARQALEKLQSNLRDITGNPAIQISDFREYWGYTSLETVARGALLRPPEKEELSDAQIKEIVLNILNHEEAEMDWWLACLRINTGLHNLTDYIFYPDQAGLDEEADLAQIADKILADRK